MMQNTLVDRLVMIFLTGVYIWILIAGATSDVIEVDAAQYAAISMETEKDGNYLMITERGEDYLDKPPFLFWINALSFKIFGYTNLGYKLPSVLFSLIGVLYTLKLGSFFLILKGGGWRH